MSMNYDDPNRPMSSATDDEGLLFAPVPAWERGKKRRGMGLGGSAKHQAEPRTFADTPADATTYRDERTTVAATGAGLAGATTMDTRTGFGPGSTTVVNEIDDDAGISAPIGRRTTTTRAAKGGIPAAAVAVGVLALAGLGAAGWYASQDNNDEVAVLTPGVTDTSGAALATAPLAPPVAESRPTQMAAAEPARATVRTTTTTTTTRRATAARTARSAATSATEAGINASGTATLPEGPQPYSTLSGATPTPPTSVTPEPTPAPVTATPAPIPSTPPVAAEPGPVNPAPENPAPTPVPDPLP